MQHPGLGRHIGILGGSFNPAHMGHMAISLTALRQLNLDQVWWLVSPQNPLKSADGMSNFNDRFRTTRAFIEETRVRQVFASDFEYQHGTRFTLDSLQTLKRCFPEKRFVWLMGADNLSQFHRWRQWEAIADTFPMAVIDRPGWTYRAIGSRAARYLAAYRMFRPQNLVEQSAPAWTFLFSRRYDISATAIRQGRATPHQKSVP